jgi:hypothetical protein
VGWRVYGVGEGERARESKDSEENEEDEEAHQAGRAIFTPNSLSTAKSPFPPRPE